MSQLDDWIELAVKRGYSETEIEDYLIKNKYSADQIISAKEMASKLRSRHDYVSHKKPYKLVVGVTAVTLIISVAVIFFAFNTKTPDVNPVLLPVEDDTVNYRVVEGTFRGFRETSIVWTKYRVAIPINITFRFRGYKRATCQPSYCTNFLS